MMTKNAPVQKWSVQKCRGTVETCITNTAGHCYVRTVFCCTWSVVEHSLLLSKIILSLLRDPQTSTT